MMNDANQISKKTKLFGYVGEEAGASRFSAVMNKKFKANGDDAMMIPMNVREDDLYFTVSNMKKSHVNGAVISDEYVDKVMDSLDEASSLSKRSGMCDVLFKEGEILRGDVLGARVLTESLKDSFASKIAVIGTNHHAKAFSFLACGFNVSYYDENLEELMEFMKEVDLIDADVNRIAKGMSLDLSNFDAVLDFSNMSDLSMLERLPKFNFAMKNDKRFSALKRRAGELNAEYVSYDDLIEKFCDRAYLAITK